MIATYRSDFEGIFTLAKICNEKVFMRQYYEFFFLFLRCCWVVVKKTSRVFTGCINGLLE